MRARHKGPLAFRRIQKLGIELARIRQDDVSCEIADLVAGARVAAQLRHTLAAQRR